jgi:uncharacterized protein YkwD
MGPPNWAFAKNRALINRHHCMHSVTHSDARRVSVLFVAVLVLGTAPTVATARQQKPQPTVEATALANRIHAQINEQRKKHGLQSLAWNDALSRIAAKHSRDMANRNYLGHDSPEGKTFSHRYQQEGYSCEIRIGNLIYAGAENIALSRLYNSTTTENNIAYYNWNSAQEIARKTVDGWMNSPGHRKNILTPHWRQEGIGIEVGPDNKIYITQNFC